MSRRGSPLTDAAARTRWAAVPTRPAGQPVDAAIGRRRPAAVRDPAPVVAALNRLPDELVETIELPAALASALIAGQPAAADRLARLVGVLREQHLAAALPLVDTGNRVLLVCSVIGLPQAGLNLAERRATGFRWYTVGLGGGTAEIKAVGARTTVRGHSRRAGGRGGALLRADRPDRPVRVPGGAARRGDAEPAPSTSG